jgi:uncharacterized protein YcaQ
MTQIALSAARNLMLAALGLLQPQQETATKASVLAAIHRMGALQIDTISVVARSPYLVLWSRLGDYQPPWLDELLAEGALFEYWAHAACWLPIEDYPLYRQRMLDDAHSWWDNPRKWLGEHPEMTEKILSRIRQEGGLRSSDFENSRQHSNGWWDWKEEKHALEHLFNTGVLMIARRNKFQRVYDLRERVYPGWDDANTPSPEVARRELALKSIRAMGIARASWVPHYFHYLSKRDTPALVKLLAEQGELVEVEVEGWSEPAYVHHDNLSLLEAAASHVLQPTLTTLLSPFDPLIWDRARAKVMFGFDYSIGCYTPAAKRRYGYYALPILYQGELVGRLDAKAHRAAKKFEVKGLWLEPGYELKGALAEELKNTLQACASWHGTPEVVGVAFNASS